MPELPEVETIIRHLKPRLTGRKILDMSSNTPRIFRDHKSFSEVRKQVLNKKIESIERAGKNILLHLSGNTCLAIHLMMTGKLLIDPQEESRHDRFVMELSGPTRLVLNDIRKFGRCRVVADPKALGGVDALSLNFETLKYLLGSRKTPIKVFLLNQSLVAGIGNIYADEILWQAGIHPLRRIDALDNKEIKSLFCAIKKVLMLAIKKGGTSSRDYRKPDGSKGAYYKIRKVYQRTGEKCRRDGAKIQRIVIGGRSSHFCPKHQKL